jgi:hypothetical protein
LISMGPISVYSICICLLLGVGMAQTGWLEFISCYGQRFFSSPEGLWGLPSHEFNGYQELLPQCINWWGCEADKLHLVPNLRMVALYFHSLLNSLCVIEHH